MKAGDIVTIYQDPLTEQKQEGQARLIERKTIDDLFLEYWTVHFLRDEVYEVVDRCIKKEKCK